MTQSLSILTPARALRRAALALAAATPLLAGCGSADPTLYSLAPTQGSPMGQAPAVIEVRTPGVPPALDRDHIVGQQANYSLTTLPGAAWSEPLAQMIGDTLTSDLQQRLPGSSIFAQNNATSMPAKAFVELDVTQFARDATGQVRLSGTLSVHRAGDPEAGTAQAFSLATASGSGATAMVAGLSQLLGQVADSAAQRLQTLPAEEAPHHAR
ncbi:PqiC family protein [Gluconacetobacter entanii]|uniref:PqiC family protein n=1 Tax=Gluconacetobacter entanii TaxID=108528 RepID=A0ABT3K5X9_9PROT|nr:PqiC family protein [Gluconacetobacter entanii]MCW4590823.1 PqiC family protein [Gluconacetobacter entanii]MCW4593990.1 PqiC family protein [Gluconacetobacter entanii]NPC90147.1 membrane integrity-associated transporter subunit PqiC [Gluconacetobacter entanii]